MDNFKLNDTDLLARFPGVRRLHINLDRRVDLGGLKHLAEGLAVLFINDDINTVTDFTPFTRLERLAVRWHPKTHFPEEMPAMHALALIQFKPGSKDLSTLPRLPSLRTLALPSARLETLHGLAQLPSLEELRLFRVRGLQEIGDIGELRSLHTLELDGCKGEFDLPNALRPGSALTALTYTACTALDSLAFVSDLPQLESLVFLDTDVTDGDMTPLAAHPSLRHVAFTKKMHFSHSERELNDLYAQRARR